MSKKYNISFTAHPDIELGWERKPLEAHLELPERIDENTGYFSPKTWCGGHNPGEKSAICP